MLEVGSGAHGLIFFFDALEIGPFADHTVHLTPRAARALFRPTGLQIVSGRVDFGAARRGAAAAPRHVGDRLKRIFYKNARLDIIARRRGTVWAARDLQGGASRTRGAILPPTSADAEHQHDSLSITDPERTIEFEFVRATENAARQAIHWLGRGQKEQADAAASDAIRGVLDLVDICGDVAIGEGVKDDAPGIFLGDKLGTWSAGSPHFDIAVDPIDGTTNLANGAPNAISVMAASQRRPGRGTALRHLPAFYSMKMAYGPPVVKATHAGLDAIGLDDALSLTLQRVADALGKRLRDVVVASLDRPRHRDIIRAVRDAGAALRLVSDGDVNLGVAPSLLDSGVDLFIGIGPSPEGVSPPRRSRHWAITHSILMRARSRTVRYIRAVHDLDHKVIHMRKPLTANDQ